MTQPPEVKRAAVVTHGRPEAIRSCSRTMSIPVTREPAETFYGGYAGAFRDLDGHAWEIAHNPGFGLNDDGSVTLPA